MKQNLKIIQNTGQTAYAVMTGNQLQPEKEPVHITEELNTGFMTTAQNYIPVEANDFFIKKKYL